MDKIKRNTILIVIISSLGYFVDIYDLVIFSVVRVKSFADIGISGDSALSATQYVLNMQMVGLLLGGIFWGILGDKLGRIKVLFGSIIIYSIANIINGFVHNLDFYAWIRLVAGIGLAGELGIGVTLVSETISKEKRGYGTMLIAAVGVLGAVAAFEVSEVFDWRNAYIFGGIMGFLLLLLRLGAYESKMFVKTEKNSHIKKGEISMLFNNKNRFSRFLKVLMIGLPTWFVVGIFITLSPEFGKALHSTEPLSPGKGILYTYIGISLGDLLAGLLAQILKSRLKTVIIFQLISLFFCILYLNSVNITPEKFQIIALLMGIGVGYWATFITISSEQFGTNLRATVTTITPNVVRAALIPSTFLFNFFMKKYDIIVSGYIMIFLLSGLSIYALFSLKETFSKDLDYVEE